MKLQFIFLFNYFVFINCLSYSNSNNFLSNYFNSNKFNSYSNNFLSNSNKNTYLSYVVSHSFQSSNQLIYSFSSSYKQNNIWVPTIMPTKVNTIMPTKVNTKISAPIISFDTKISFNNYNTIKLDEKSQTVIILATASSMNISSSFIKYIGSDIQSRRKLFRYIFELQGFNIQVYLQTNIPLEDKFASFINNPRALYSTITTNLVNSVSSGLFQNYLQAASNALKITNFANSTILSVQTDNYIIKAPNSNKTYKNNNNTDFKSIIYVVLFTIIILTLVKISYDFQTKKKPCECVKFTSLNLTLDVNEINININEPK